MRPTVASMTHSILDHHRRMNESIVALESTVRTTDRVEAPRGVVTACVVALRHELARHFASEEDAGLFDQIERNAPETAEACVRLQAQHAAILAELDHLRDSLPPTGTPPREAESWAAAVRALVAEVRAHERREDELLLAALDRSDGAPD
jgi:iron-sulfur cluster repair protein YtfE (RIC family)